MLGGLRAYQPEREITRFQTVKTGALLAFLACHIQRAHTREELIALLWPDSTLDQGRPSLSVALSSLRHQLEPPGVPAGAVLTANRVSVQLNPDACVTDVALFESAVQRAGRAESADEKARLLAEVAELYRGDLLPGYYDDWCLAERRRLADLCCQALRDLVRLSAKAGDRARAGLCAQGHQRRSSARRPACRPDASVRGGQAAFGSPAAIPRIRTAAQRGVWLDSLGIAQASGP